MTDWDWVTLFACILVLIAAVVWHFTNPDREKM